MSQSTSSFGGRFGKATPVAFNASTNQHPRRLRRCEYWWATRMDATALLVVSPTASPQGNRSGTMASYLFGKLPGGLLNGSRQQLETGTRCFGPSSLRVEHEARRRGRRQFENEGGVVRGCELNKNSYRPPNQRRRNKPPERPATGTEVGREDRPLHEAL